MTVSLILEGCGKNFEVIHLGSNGMKERSVFTDHEYDLEK